MNKDIWRVGFTVAMLCGFLIYLALGQFSEYWLGVITNHGVGEDFHIYYDAYIKAASGDSPYLPYDIGDSFVNHPFVLSFLSLFSWHQERFLATFFWVVTSAIAWVFVVWLVFHMVRVGMADRATREVDRYFGWILATFLTFAPFWETIHIGQINVFALLCLCLMFNFSEQEKPVLSGLFLALAIALKSSPVIFVFYYLVLRKFALLTSCVVSLLVLSLTPSIQFSPSVLTDFITVLPKIGREIHPTVYNQSILSLSFRMLGRFGWENMGPVFVWGHRIAMVLTLDVVLFPLLVGSSSKTSRLWAFALLLTIMTLFSPLVWYHHSLFLIVPLVILILHSNRLYAVTSIGILGVIQSERLFEYKTANLAWPILLAGFALLGLGIWTHYDDWRRSSITTRH
jgi:alpha-1,2-mannosyltransferase